MRKAGFIVGAIALVAIGGVCGVLGQSQYQVIASQRAEESVRQLIGIDEPAPSAPPVEYWTYPGAKLHSRGSGGRVTMNDEILVPNTHNATWTTPDRFEDVIRFYAEHLGFEKPDSFVERRPSAGGSVHGSVDSGKGPASNHHIIDNRSPEQPPIKLRSVRVESLVRRCRSFYLTVFITRADDENHTHIIAVYDPLTDISANNEEN